MRVNNAKTLIMQRMISLPIDPFNPSDFLKTRSVVPTAFFRKLPLDVYIRHDFFSQLPFAVYIRFY